MHDMFPLKGRLQVVLTGPQGEVKYNSTVDNLIVQAGKNFVASALATASSAPFAYMAVGTSSTAAAFADTALGAEVSRVLNTSSTAVANVVTFLCTFGPGVGTGSLQEAGLFNAVTGGTMLSHVIFSTVSKAAADSLQITWTVTAG